MTRRSLCVLAALSLAAVALASPAHAVNERAKKPKKLTPETLTTLLLTGSEAARATGFTGSVNYMENFTPACGLEGKATLCRVVYKSDATAGDSPYSLGVVIYPTKKAARAGAGRLPMLGGNIRDSVIKRTPKEIDLYLDYEPGEVMADVFARVAVVGRFLVVTMCTNLLNVGTQAGLDTCATSLANQMAKKLTPYQSKGG